MTDDEKLFGLNYAAIILAAGKASRFGGNKLLSEINQIPIIGHSLTVFKALQNSIDPIIVVVGAYQEEMSNYLERFTGIKIVYNPNFETGGMISSIQYGINALKNTYPRVKGVFIHPADIPFIRTDDIEGMITSIETNQFPLVVPYFNNKRGHPILINSNILHELDYLNEENQGLRGLLNKYNKNTGFYNTLNEGIHNDIDYKKDLDKWE